MHARDRPAPSAHAGTHRTAARCCASRAARLGNAIPGEAVRQRQLGGLGNAVNEAGGFRRMLLKARVPQHAQLLQQRRPLAPEAALGHRIAAEVDRHGLFGDGLPARHVVQRQQARVVFPAGVAYRFAAAVPVDFAGDETGLPDAHRSLDHAGARIAFALRFFQQALVHRGQRGLAKQRAGLRDLALRQPHGGGRRPVLQEQLAHREDGLRDARHQREAVARIVDARAPAHRPATRCHAPATSSSRRRTRQAPWPAANRCPAPVRNPWP